jgi:hypothetical protein
MIVARPQIGYNKCQRKDFYPLHPMERTGLGKFTREEVGLTLKATE